MKNLLLVLTLFLVLPFFHSCENHETDSTEQNIDLSNLKLNLDIDFKNQDDITFSITEDLSKEEIANTLATSYNKLSPNIEETIKADNNIDAVLFDIVVSNNEIRYTNFKFNSLTENDNPVFNCPNKSTLINTCWDESCINQAIQTVFSNAKSGEKALITIHHSGKLGGVKICAL